MRTALPRTSRISSKILKETKFLSERSWSTDPARPKIVSVFTSMATKPSQVSSSATTKKAGGDWRGDYLVVDWEELEEAEHAREVHINRVEEVNKLTLNGNFRFPLAEDILSQPAPGATQLRKLTQRLS